MLRRLGATGKTLLIDVKPDDGFALSARNLAGVKLVASARVTARDVSDTAHVVATRAALETLQEPGITAACSCCPLRHADRSGKREAGSGSWKLT